MNGGGINNLEVCIKSMKRIFNDIDGFDDMMAFV